MKNRKEENNLQIYWWRVVELVLLTTWICTVAIHCSKHLEITPSHRRISLSSNHLVVDRKAKGNSQTLRICYDYLSWSHPSRSGHKQHQQYICSLEVWSHAESSISLNATKKPHSPCFFVRFQVSPHEATVECFWRTCHKCRYQPVSRIQ